MKTAVKKKVSIMATSTFQIDLTFTNSTQTGANTKRDNALVDFCEALGIDIRTNGTIDQAKVASGTRTAVRTFIKRTIVQYRTRDAQITAANTENTNLGDL